MTVDHFDPAWTIAPGMLFAEQVAEQGLSQQAIAQRLGVDREWLSAFVDGDTELTPALAQALAALTSTDAQMWLHLERRYRNDLENGKSVLGH